MTEACVGVIGGSGLYEMDGLTDLQEVRVTTPFGDPSDAIIQGRLGDVKLLFLPRHGRGHRIPPQRINFRANIHALKQLGASQIISVSAVGSLKESIHPGEIVLVDQFIDRTRRRINSFFEDHDVVAHVSFADPVDAALVEALGAAAARVAPQKTHRGGTYVCIEGPQFSTRAESMLFRSWGADVVGMTNLPEARLAREAELPYATMALVTDYDCWHESEAEVSVDAVLAVLKSNADKARAIIREVAGALPDPTRSPATQALRYAIVTQPELIPDEAREKLRLIIGKYL